MLDIYSGFLVYGTDIELASGNFSQFAMENGPFIVDGLGLLEMVGNRWEIIRNGKPSIGYEWDNH